MLENFELQLGAVGPVALGEETQNGFHDLIGQNRAPELSACRKRDLKRITLNLTRYRADNRETDFPIVAGRR